MKEKKSNYNKPVPPTTIKINTHQYFFLAEEKKGGFLILRLI
jgi:hypothetical protein